MADCEVQLWDLVKKIEPTPTQKLGAKRSHNFLRNILCTGDMAVKITGHYLSGSYARKTAIYPLDDVDIIFTIDPTQWDKPFDPISTFFFGSKKYPEPSDILDSFAGAIHSRYPNSSVHHQRRSIRLQLYHLNIDVVPAIQDKYNEKRIRIPDSNSGGWIISSTKLHSENATIVNKQNSGRFKPLVKLLKYWNYNLPSTATFKSFAIETMAVQIFKDNNIPSLQEGLILFFDFISYVSGNQSDYIWKNKSEISLNWFSNSIPDAAGTGTNIIEGIDDERRKRFVENAIRSRNKMAESFNTNSIEIACRKVSQALKM
jgi:hypothetical protein